MSSINDLLTLHQYKLAQQGHGMDSFADQLNAQMEQKYQEKKKKDRQDTLLKRLKENTGDMQREITLDDEGKITAKFSDKSETGSRSYDKDVWKRAEDIAKATNAGDNPFYTPSIDQIMQALPAARAMFEGNYPSMAAPSPAVTPQPTPGAPAAGGGGFNFGQMFGGLLQRFMPQQQAPEQAAGMNQNAQTKQAVETVRKQAIQELQNAGYPVTEANIKAIMDQLQKQGA